MKRKKIIIIIGKGAVHSLTIGATIVIDLAIMPQVPTDVFLFYGGNILSSVKETWVVVMKDMIMPIFNTRMITHIAFSSNASLISLSLNGIILVYIIRIPNAPTIDIQKERM